MTYPMIIKVVLLSLLVISNGADVELMKKECSYTDYQNRCLKCLESDPASHQVTATHVGFAQTVINCLESQLVLVTNVTSVIASKKNESEAIKNVLVDCEVYFLAAALQLVEVNDTVSNGNYTKATEGVETALSFPLTCRDNLRKIKFNASPEVYNEIGVYAQLSSVAKTLIRRLQYFI